MFGSYFSLHRFMGVAPLAFIKSILLANLLIYAYFICAQFTATDTLEGYAKRCVHEGLYERALQAYNQLINTHPHRPELWIERGNVYIYLFQFQKALQNYQSALYLDSLHATAYAYMGEYYYLMQHSNLAHKMLDKALSIQPGHSYALTHKGLVYFESGEPEKAYPFLNAAIQADSQNAMLYYNRGYCHFAEKKYTLAIQDFEKGLVLNPNRFFLERIYEYYVEALMMNFQHNKALQICDSATAHRFDFDNRKANVYFHAQQLDSALFYAQRYLNLYKNDLQMTTLIADIYWMKEAKDMSCIYYKRACKISRSTSTYIPERMMPCDEYVKKCKK
ncbi:MAG: tetratricopeptide repeat protein [Cytophagaceae bacterium]|nr:tetratricopeptide repeat protein [Cytophagaceae bacterium]MDW8456339.1 tetratricopeptide repeat protein [Cytophagaceae bacterium]